MKNDTTNIVLPDFSKSPRIDKVGVEEQVAKFQKRSVKAETKKQGLRMALNMIDLTTLEGKDTPGKVKQLCYKAQHVHDILPGLPKVAAVCVYPSMVALAKKELEGTGINVASVSTAFPSGQAPLGMKLADTKFAVDSGADEIDMVISRGKYLSGEYNFVFDEIAVIKEGYFAVIKYSGRPDLINTYQKASDIAMYAGADFIKTSTGKIQPAATMQVTCVMLEAIRDFMDTTGIKVGMKPAGGISNSKLALHNLVMVNEVLGSEWLSNEWFRFGASSLANDVLMQIVKAETGVYQSSNYFSID